jgi:hypothetical protein
MTDDPNRNTDGTFAVGNCANPNGANGNKRGWQKYGVRIAGWLEKLSAEELKILVNTPSEYGKLSSIDAIAVRHIVNALTGDDIRQERKDMLDRIEGAPKQTTVLEGDENRPLRVIQCNPASAASNAGNNLLRAPLALPETA